MTERIREFLRNRRNEGQDVEPCLVVDLDVVRDNYNAFAKALPDTRVFYAVKANPAPEVLTLLAKLGSCFDTASVAEIEMVLAAGATADRISYGNTIKKERDIARAYALGVRLFAVDCKAEVEKIARAAPGAKVFCRFQAHTAESLFVEKHLQYRVDVLGDKIVGERHKRLLPGLQLFLFLGLPDLIDDVAFHRQPVSHGKARRFARIRVDHEPVPHFLPVGLIHMLPAVHKKRAFIVEADIKKFRTPGGHGRHSPFLHLLSTVRTEGFIF